MLGVITEQRKQLKATMPPGWLYFHLFTTAYEVQWCGRPQGHLRVIINADSPEELAEQAWAWGKARAPATP